MPDLQSELSKVLSQTNFDDEPGAKAPPTVIDTAPRRGGRRPQAQSNRRKVWEYIRANENSTVSDVVRATGYTAAFCHSSIGAMLSSGRLVRTEVGGKSCYSAISDNYEDRLLKREATTLKVPKAPVKPLAQIKRDLGLPPTPAPTAFDPDSVINQLNVVQAKALLVRLMTLFGV